MRKGLNLMELAQRIEDNAKAKHDMIASTAAVELAVNDDRKVVLNVPGAATGSAVSFPIRPIAHDQIGSYVDIPGKYYDRMLADQPELLARNVNTWLHSRPKPDKRMVRTIHGEARAFLSNRYQRIENEEIASVVLPILGGMKGISIVSAEVTERRLYIQATTDRVQGEVKKGDVVQAGLIVSNSEVGHGSVAVKPLIYRLVCLNGMVLPDNTYRANHTGRRIDDNEDLWKDDTREADDKAILLKVRDMVTAAFDEKFFRAQVEKFAEAAGQEVKGDPAKAVEVLAKKLGVNDGERGGILRDLIKGGDLSRWGFANAVTAQAHTVESYDRVVEFEQLGSKVIDLSPSDWSEVAQAA